MKSLIRFLSQAAHLGRVCGRGNIILIRHHAVSSLCGGHMQPHFRCITRAVAVWAGISAGLWSWEIGGLVLVLQWCAWEIAGEDHCQGARAVPVFWRWWATEQWVLLSLAEPVRGGFISKATSLNWDGLFSFSYSRAL